ncbi:MAG: hypothetical protein M0025_08895 [Elusimicrobia bacterium]|nr:hypothetical protein [Elusimicrobiota bacterium]
MRPVDMDRAAVSWFTGAWDDYVSRLPLVLAVTLTQAALSAGTFLIISRTHTMLTSLPYMLLVITPVTVGANLVYIKIARGTGGAYGDLFSAFPVYHRAVAVSLLLGLATTGGALLLVLPGVIVYLTYMFSEFAVVDLRGGVKESFAVSAAATDGWKVRLFPLLMATAAINFVVPDIYVIKGFRHSQASLDLRPWTVTASVLKDLVFLPWLNMAAARAYAFLLPAALRTGRPAAE